MFVFSYLNDGHIYDCGRLGRSACDGAQFVGFVKVVACVKMPKSRAYSPRVGRRDVTGVVISVPQYGIAWGPASAFSL